mmetsp:Transcript_43232/g.78672  ORF Transcript_43232/g.78672 Transcript_43232/m.78672 type:complete len:335 (-) Transcript_43232:124-1128(-)
MFAYPSGRMGNYVALWCAWIASVRAFRSIEHPQDSLQGKDAVPPGCACQVSTCCEQGSLDDDPWDFVNNESRVRSTESDWLGGESAACSLLGLSPNLTGRCDKSKTKRGANEALDVGTALAQDLPEFEFPVLSVIAEPGDCEELSANACPTAPGPPTREMATALWTKNLYYKKEMPPGMRSLCRKNFLFARMLSEAGEQGTLVYAATCADDGEGVRLRARWNPMLAADVCDLGAHPDVDKVVTLDDWNLPRLSGLPRWTCVDVNGPLFTPQYRMVAYSFGPTPCGRQPAEPGSTPPFASALFKSHSGCPALLSGSIAISILALHILLKAWAMAT